MSNIVKYRQNCQHNLHSIYTKRIVRELEFKRNTNLLANIHITDQLAESTQTTPTSMEFLAAVTPQAC
jgi:hypothetical protein